MSKEYLLHTGNSDQERLDVLAEIYDKGSQDFLLNQLPKETSNLLEVGCGHGHIAFWLAKNFPTCNIIGIDSSEEQVTICKQYKSQHNISNTKFMVHDIVNKKLDQKLDAVHIRFLLMHIKDWDACFENILNSCKKGASILIEESGFPFVCLPEENELFKRANYLVNQLANRTELKYDCFPLLWKYIKHLNVKVESVQFNLPVLTTEREKSFPWRCFEQIRQPLIMTGLSSDQEITEIVTNLQKVAADPKEIILSWRLMQLHLKTK